MRKDRKDVRRSSFEYREEKCRNLLEVFNSELGKDVRDKVEDVLRRVVDRPARRFWVSEERALRVVSLMERTHMPPPCKGLRREMYEEIWRRCVSLLEEHPDWSLCRRVYYVVNREAPKFYMTVNYVHHLICEEKRVCRIERMLRSRHLLAA